MFAANHMDETVTGSVEVWKCVDRRATKGQGMESGAIFVAATVNNTPSYRPLHVH